MDEWYHCHGPSDMELEDTYGDCNEQAKPQHTLQDLLYYIGFQEEDVFAVFQRMGQPGIDLTAALFEQAERIAARGEHLKLWKEVCSDLALS